MEEELKDVLIGTKLGWGIHRDVYKCKIDDSFVVKVEREDHNFANIIEWKIWEEVQYAENLARWFAPCERISTNGKILIQKKVEMGRKKDYPRQIPAFFTDVKMENFGFIGNQLVCFDYASIVWSRNLNEKKMKKVIWF